MILGSKHVGAILNILI